MLPWVAVLFVAGCTCEEPAKVEERQKAVSSTQLVAEGRAALAKGEPKKAVAAFTKAISVTPQDVSLYINLAEAHRAAGNETGAILALKQAEDVGGSDPSIKRARADLYLKQHKQKEAIGELLALRDLDLLTEKEILELARLLAYSRRVDDAFKTLEKIQLQAPDDPEAKVVEAEVMLVKGDELLAAQLMDRLLEKDPALTNARVLRARYFFGNDQAELAYKDLELIANDDAKRGDVVTLKARVLNSLGRFEEAASLLQHLIEENPKDAETLALLAETKLLQGDAAEAQSLVDKALTLEPKWARALYVRGRAMEQQKKLDDAVVDYEGALKSDPWFAPALSRLWRLYDKRGQKAEAINQLEQLLYMNEITADEKVALARYYAETWANVERGKKLIAEALRRDPKNAEYKKIQAKLSKGAAGAKQGSGIIIMKHR